MIDFKGSQFERAIILWAVRRYVAYPISYQQLEEMVTERGGIVDHSRLRGHHYIGDRSRRSHTRWHLASFLFEDSVESVLPNSSFRPVQVVPAVRSAVGILSRGLRSVSRPLCLFRTVCSRHPNAKGRALP